MNKYCGIGVRIFRSMAFIIYSIISRNNVIQAPLCLSSYVISGNQYNYLRNVSRISQSACRFNFNIYLKYSKDEIIIYVFDWIWL